MPKTPKSYAVFIGRQGPAIYSTWDECKEQVSRYPGAIHKSFPSRTQAEAWLASLSASGTKRPLPRAPETTAPDISSRQPPSRELDVKEQPPRVVLSPEQRQVLDRVKQGRSVFFTGSAGTGKSVLLREIIRFVRESGKTIGITASTGIAAVNIGGSTLHSWAGIGLGEQDPKRYIGKFFGSPQFHNIRARWEQVDTLLIDEISMIDGTMFDKLERIAQGMRDNDRPFGGIQLVLSGDFFQLPPVPQRNKKGEQIQPKFAFEANTWDSCVGPPVTLTRVFRQKNQAFVNMLNAMRLGQMNDDVIAAFQQLSRPVTYDDGIEPTELYPTRNEVDTANSLRLERLKTGTHTYAAWDHAGVDSNGKRIDAIQMNRVLERLVVPKTLQLKVGAQVMLVKNLIQGELVNGSVGQVVRFNTVAEALKDGTRIVTTGDRNNPSGDEAWPVVRFIGGRETMCIPEEFTVDNADGTTEARRDQVPFILAWALSVHKSQGQTLERVKVDLRRTFEKGQAYVALSRATSLEQLQVLNFNPAKVEAHSRVLAWYSGGRPLKRSLGDLLDSDEEMDNEEAQTTYYDW